MKNKLMVFPLLMCALSSLTARADVIKGGEIYKTKCAMCHGPDGKGETAMGKNLKLRDLGAADVQNVHDSELKTLLESGKGKMPAFKGKLTDAQMGDVIQYVRSLKKK
jgi:cytochrome c6